MVLLGECKIQYFLGLVHFTMLLCTMLNAKANPCHGLIGTLTDLELDPEQH